MINLRGANCRIEWLRHVCWHHWALGGKKSISVAVGMKMASEIVIEVGSKDVEKARPEEVPRNMLRSIQIQGSCEVRPVVSRQIVQLQKSIAERATEPPEYLLAISD